MRYRRTRLRRARAVAACERLERRTLLTAVTFTGQGDSFNWTDPKNWSNGQVPTAADDVTIGSATDFRSVQINAAGQAAHSITDFGFLSLDQGSSLTVGTTIQLSQSASFSMFQSVLHGGTITATGNGTARFQGSTLDGVTLNAPSTVISFSNDPTTAVNGLTVNSTLVLGEQGDFTEAGILNFQGTQTLGGTGTVSLFHNPESQINVTEIGGTTVIPATLTIGRNVTIDGQGVITSAAPDAIVNQGTIDADSQGATLQVNAQSFTNQGTLKEQNGGILSVSGGPNGGGTYTVTGGTASINGAINIGTLNVSGGTLNVNVPSNQFVNISALHFSGGTIGGTGNFHLIGPGSTWTGGTFVGTGATFVDPVATLSVDGNVLHLSSRPFGNFGTVNLTAGTLQLNGGGKQGGTFNLAANTTLTFGGSGLTNFLANSSVSGPAASVIFTDSASALLGGTYHVNSTLIDTTALARFTASGATTNLLTSNGGTLVLGLPTASPARVAKTAGNVLMVIVKHLITDGATIVLPGWTLEDEGAGLQFVGSASPTVTLSADTGSPGRLLLGGDVTFTGTGGSPSILSTTGLGMRGSIDLAGARSFTVTGGTLGVTASIGDGSVRAAGSGVLQLNATNTYAGGTTVATSGTGHLEIDNASALGSGAVTFAGGTLALRNLPANVTLANPLAAASTDSILLDVGSSAVQVPGITAGSSFAATGTGGSVTVNGPVTLHHDLTINNAIPVTINGAISGGFALTKTGTAALTLGGASANTYTGPTEVVAGTLALNKSSGAAVPAALRIDGPAGVTTSASNQFGGGTAVTFDSTAGTPTLAINNTTQSIASVSSFQAGAGSISLGTGSLAIGSGNYSGALTGTGLLIKQGAGTLALGQLFAGNALTVSGGTLAMAATGANHLGALHLTGGKFDLAGSTLQVTYGGGTSPAPDVRAAFAAGTLFSSTAGTLGFADGADGVVPAGTLVVKPAAQGDANLDGQVNFSDLLLLAQHYGRPNSLWDQGDFNYDGTVTFSDLLLLAQDYGKTKTRLGLGTL